MPVTIPSVQWILLFVNFPLSVSVWVLIDQQSGTAGGMVIKKADLYTRSWTHRRMNLPAYLQFFSTAKAQFLDL